MAWQFDSDTPIYQQIIKRMLLDIFSGKYPPGSKLPSVRYLANEASVSPNTVQKSYAELEEKGIVIPQRNSRRVLTEDKSIISKIRLQTAMETTKEYVEKMQTLGLPPEMILELIKGITD